MQHSPSFGCNLRAIARLLALWLATSVLLLLPDMLLYWSGYPVNAAASLKAVSFAAVIAFLVSTMRSRRFRMVIITFLTLNQLIWTGYVIYFGQALSPDHLMLFRHEAIDTALGVLAEWQSMLPWLLTVLAGGAVLGIIQWSDVPKANWRTRKSGVAFIAIAVAAITAWMLHPRIDAAFPGKHTASMYGPLQAAVGTVRIELTHVAAKNLNVVGQTQAQVPLDSEPITVVVIMGESINPTRLSLYGFRRATTPQLTLWRSSPPTGFTLIPQIGFSGGLDTYASVPGFLCAAYWPVRAQQYGVNLFELAHRQGFKSWYFTAQTLNFLEAAGGAPNAERVTAVKDDEKLAGLAQAIASDSQRTFVFFHQRVNHVPYTGNCSPPPEGQQVFEPETQSAEDRRRAAYDNGLRCWDRGVSAIVQPFLKRPGAVHIFITADHNELMAETGSWGHGFADLRVALVPMVLLTNRPHSDVATLFKSWSPPTSYHLAQTVARALGVRLETPGVTANRFFLNITMPFALAGFFEAEQLKPGVYRVQNFARNGQKLSDETAILPEVGAANADYAPPAVLSAPLKVKEGAAERVFASNSSSTLQRQPSCLISRIQCGLRAVHRPPSQSWGE